MPNISPKTLGIVFLLSAGKYVKDVAGFMVQLLEKNNLIESKYKIISNGSLYDTHWLTVKNISEGFIIYEKLSI